jgi:hypothetical protein
MALFRLIAEGEAREVYVVEAASEDDARRIFEAGEAAAPEVSEVIGAEVVDVEEVDPVDG